jgi:hypothetical protein
LIKKFKGKKNLLTIKRKGENEESVMDKQQTIEKEKEEKERAKYLEGLLCIMDELVVQIKELEKAFMDLSKVRPLKKKSVQIAYRNPKYVKQVMANKPESFSYTIYQGSRMIATVVLRRLCSSASAPNVYARGIAICGPKDKNITTMKGREIAFRRANFSLEERLSTGIIRRNNRNIEIVKEEFRTKYKAQYRPLPTEYEKMLIANRECAS